MKEKEGRKGGRERGKAKRQIFIIWLLGYGEAQED
jgi:hypothetical protein